MPAGPTPPVRAIGGLLFLIGAGVGSYNVWMTVKTQSRAPEAAADRPAAFGAAPALEAGE